MKTKLLFFLMFLLAITGCDKIKDTATINVTTQLNASIPVVVTSIGMKSAGLVAASGDFSATADLDLTSNEEIAPYIDRIKTINLNTLIVTINGLSAGQTINTVSLNVAGVGVIFTQNNITMGNNSFTPTIAQEILDKVASKLTTDRKITLTVSGNASGPMIFTVDLNIDSTLVVYTLQ